MSLYLQIACVLCAVKLLLWPSYYSTDLEVHRNWLSITHSLPIKDWYLDDASPWTLDYPPLFAWFQWLLARAAPLFDPGMLPRHALNHDSPATILFQRLTVIAADAVLLLGAAAVAAPSGAKSRPTPAAPLRFALVACNAGLLMVDHIHFQYNGILLGLLLLSCAAMHSRQLDARGPPIAAALFTSLVNLKHLYAMLGPLYLVHMLVHYCGAKRATWVPRFLLCAGIVIGITALSLGPFLATGQAVALWRRLFPWGRGLCHAYWAPNLWALYAAADRLLARLRGVEAGGGGPTHGVVGSAAFAVLPEVGPAVSAACVLAGLAPVLVAAARRRAPPRFSDLVAGAGMAGFLFGFHVHEKAVLGVVLPLCAGALDSPQAALRFWTLSTVAHVSLFPLLFRPQEALPKVLITLLYAALAWEGVRWTRVEAAASQSDAVIETGGAVEPFPDSLSDRRSDEVGGRGESPGVARPAASGGTKQRGCQAKLHPAIMMYLAGLCCIAVLSLDLVPLLPSLPFLPLMLMSTYAACGLLGCWLHLILHT